jgi:hypothetical protein
MFLQELYFKSEAGCDKSVRANVGGAKVPAPTNQISVGSILKEVTLSRAGTHSIDILKHVT